MVVHSGTRVGPRHEPVGRLVDVDLLLDVHLCEGCEVLELAERDLAVVVGVDDVEQDGQKVGGEVRAELVHEL